MPAAADMNAEDATEKTSDKTTKATKVKKSSLKSRAPARPFKKLEQNILDSRLADARKKLAVWQSKAVLVQDKVDAYERELQLREGSADASTDA